ncbi:low choriolytic enzyme-like isoform X2 [Bradysia coprophila]|uniref:low choriolytic enzyme-like isoform X2 n=1 Tax=Bradysia coprophila TaxID=38358 RepID=UPI00187D9F3D|nr:low choriolytic enzyme-like isoform X2 [Bradysia coprophila]
MVQPKKLFLFCSLMLVICVFSAPVENDKNDVELNEEELTAPSDAENIKNIVELNETELTASVDVANNKNDVKLNDEELAASVDVDNNKNDVELNEEELTASVDVDNNKNDVELNEEELTASVDVENNKNDVELTEQQLIEYTENNTVPYDDVDENDEDDGNDEDEESEEDNQDYEDDVEVRSPVKQLVPCAMSNKWPVTSEQPYQAIVPILIREKDFTTEALENFQAALKDIEGKTCVRFVNASKSHKDFIFVHDSGNKKCTSKIGRVGGKQHLKLTNHCMLARRTCVHELMHALGFNHMHQRYDRDSELSIKWENIKQKDKRWFEKLDNEWESYNTPYDVLSCMHYGKKGFTKNGEVTIQTKNTKFQDDIGKQYTLSDGDVQRIVRMYSCPVPVQY